LLETFNEAGSGTRVLPADSERAEMVLYRLQVTARSALGAMAVNCGGVITDGGWIRLLGAGYDGLGDLAEVNGLGQPGDASKPPPWLIVGYDVLGGRFAVDGGGLGIARGEVCYFGPNTLSWIGLGAGHGAFVVWACSSQVDDFYRDLRWPTWKEEVASLRLDQGLAFYPPLFSKQAKDVGACNRRPVPIDELFAFHEEMLGQVADLPPGTAIEFRTSE
jgi:hypothetical protein